jgi:hypothetical protein
MDLVKDACCPDFVDGMPCRAAHGNFLRHPARRHWHLAGDAPVARRGTFTFAGASRHRPLAIVLLTLNVGLLVLLTAALIEQLLVEHATTWYLLAFVATSWLADSFGINAWLTIRRETHDTHPLSPVR